MYYTIESSNAWGATLFLQLDRHENNAAITYRWTFKRNEATQFSTFTEAQFFQTISPLGMGKLGRIEAYTGKHDYLELKT